MIATKHAVFMMTAMIIGGIVVGVSIAATAPQAAEAAGVNTTRSNIKSSAIGQQDVDLACTNQAQGQGGQQSVPNTEQTTTTTTGDRSDPIPDIDVKMGRNPGGSGAGAGINSEGDPTVNAEQSNNCSPSLDQTVIQNGDTSDFSTNQWEG